MRGNVFISYRREDSGGWTGRLYDRIASALPRRRVFVDVVDIKPGENFADKLDAKVAQCDVFLPIIGPRWLSVHDASGNRRIDNPSDYVGIEIASALKRDNVHVIPVLVNGANMPGEQELPDTLKPLAKRNALTIDAKEFGHDSRQLIAAIKALLPWRVRHHRGLRKAGTILIVLAALAALIGAIKSGILPYAYGLERFVRPSATEWSTFTYLDKTNPALLNAFRARHPDTPEYETAGHWLNDITVRAWSKVEHSNDRNLLSDFATTFRGSAQADQARSLLASMTAAHRDDALLRASLTRFADCDRCPEMVVVPPGQFTMGSLPTEQMEDADINEQPRQQVSIARPFAVGRFEVTLGQYRAFLAENAQHRMGSECIGTLNPDSPADGWGDIPGRNYAAPGFAQDDAHPVVCVSWDDAMAYVSWLSTQTGHRYRLPTEAEWEYAARAGSQDSYTFGDDESRLCQYGNGADRPLNASWQPNRWCADGARIGTAAVGSYLANAFGLRDMHGNVHEWVEDCYFKDYSDMPEATRQSGAAMLRPDCGARVIRGGCWAYSPGGLRSASREQWQASKRSYCVGFRVAMTLED
jgi:formylglycine-generating enzyme required for sulfatase activity